MSPAWWFIPATVLAWAFAARTILTNPRGDPVAGLIYLVSRWYAYGFHNLRVVGRENIPQRAGPLIVVCNHTAGVDPVLVQMALPFEVRWMMGSDMMHPRFERFWKWTGVIGVDRKGRDLGGTREALRHLRAGGVLGVFPEGGIERPPRRLRVFHEGVGFLVAKSTSPVLPVFIEGTPQVDPAWASLTRPSRSRVRIGPVMRFEGADARDVTKGICAWFIGEAQAAGWHGAAGSDADPGRSP